MKIGIISLVSDIHDANTVDRASISLLSALKDSFDLEEIGIGDIQRVDLPIIFVKTGGTEHKFKQITSQLVEGGKPLTLLSTGSNNSLPACLEILSWANREGFKNTVLLHGPVKEIKSKLAKRAAEIQLIVALKHTKIGVMGKPSDWLIASEVDYEKASERWGVSFVNIQLEEVAENIKKFAGTDVTKVLGEFPAARFTSEVELKDIVEAVRIYLGIKKTVTDHGLSAFTLRCFDLLKTFNNTSCLALARLNDEGFPAGCEGDIPGLFTMLIDRLITETPSFIANTSRIDDHHGRITMAHCTVPMSMVESFGLKTHFETGKGIGIAGKFKKGPVTVSRIGGPQLDQFYAAEGKITANTHSDELCRTQITIKMNEGVDYFLNTPLGNHHIISNGHHARRFQEVMALFGAIRVK